MILISLGTQDFQFERLLKEIDRLIEKGVIQEEVFAQIGYNDYQPKHFKYQPFTSFEEFDALLGQCDLLITHGGTGTIVGGLKKSKKIIAVPRLKKYGEHVDNHQLEIIGYFTELDLIVGIQDVQELESALAKAAGFEPKPFVSGNKKIIGLIDGLAKTLIG